MLSYKEEWTSGTLVFFGSYCINKTNGYLCKHISLTLLGFGEPDPVNLPVGISMHGLSKSFKKRGKKHIAVDNLTANFYRGQVTAFLGENGAGKTTTM